MQHIHAETRLPVCGRLRLEIAGADDAAVRSVDRAAALLVCLAEADGSASVTDLSHALDLHKSTVSRLLSTLERRGLVEQDRESGHFRLGVGIIRLAQSAERTLDLRAIALPEMEALADLADHGQAWRMP